MSSQFPIRKHQQCSSHRPRGARSFSPFAHPPKRQCTSLPWESLLIRPSFVASLQCAIATACRSCTTRRKPRIPGEAGPNCCCIFCQPLPTYIGLRTRPSDWPGQVPLITRRSSEPSATAGRVNNNLHSAQPTETMENQLILSRKDKLLSHCLKKIKIS